MRDGCGRRAFLFAWHLGCPIEGAVPTLISKVRNQMRQVLSTILAILVISPSTPRFANGNNVAAQEVQKHENSGSSSAEIDLTNQAKPTLQIPDGTAIDIEAPYTLSSIDFKPNDKISFRVVNPVKVNGVTMIEPGAVATGRIDKAKRGGHFGKAGLFVWTMQTVTAVDGSQIPLRVAPVRLRGDSKSAKVATQMIITGALLPLIAPIALLHGFKRGKDAFIPAGKRYVVYVEGNPALMSSPTNK